MGIFGKKTEEKKTAPVTDTEVTEVKEASSTETKSSKVSLENTSVIIKRPRITEKAALLSDKGVYVFEVQGGANKHEVAHAVKQIYKVTPIKVNIVNRTPRHAMSRTKGRDVMTHGLRKAYVYLKEGDRIELV